MKPGRYVAGTLRDRTRYTVRPRGARRLATYASLPAAARATLGLDGFRSYTIKTQE